MSEPPLHHGSCCSGLVLPGMSGVFSFSKSTLMVGRRLGDTGDDLDRPLDRRVPVVLEAHHVLAFLELERLGDRRDAGLLPSTNMRAHGCASTRT